MFLQLQASAQHPRPYVIHKDNFGNIIFLNQSQHWFLNFAFFSNC